MAAIPLPPPPDGDQNRAAAILITETVFVIISLSLVLARIYTRTIVVSNFGLDDVFILLGMISAIIVLALTGAMIHYGVGRHEYYLLFQPQQLQQAIKWQFVLQPFLLISTMFTKISVCYFLLRVFGTKSHWRWILYSIMTFSIFTSLLSSVTILAQCRPVSKLWNPLLPGTCWNPNVVISIGYFNGAVSVLCDWVLASLPIAFMWDLQMNFRVKAGIWLLMGMGFFSGICVLVRTVLLNKLASPDFTWNVVSLAIWSFLEETIGIIAACIPTLKPLFTASMQTTRSARNSSKKVAREYAQRDDIYRLHNTNSHHLRSSNEIFSQAYGRDCTAASMNDSHVLSSTEWIKKETEFSVEASNIDAEDLHLSQRLELVRM